MEESAHLLTARKQKERASVPVRHTPNGPASSHLGLPPPNSPGWEPSLHIQTVAGSYGWSLDVPPKPGELTGRPYGSYWIAQV